jgi:predicted DNA-binding transcriptional regulator YafY
MRRADRLFQLIEQLRGRRTTTARQLAERLHVSERTIYRDVGDLVASGVPIEGEAGVGYVMRRGYDLPPIMFDRDELEALVLGARLVKALGGKSLADSADLALNKIDAVLPTARKSELATSRLFAPHFAVKARDIAGLDLIRSALNSRHVLELGYTREDGATSTRTIRPLALYYWPPHWLLAAWCELRQDFRSFRTDRIVEAKIGAATFVDAPGKTFEDFLRSIPNE